MWGLSVGLGGHPGGGWGSLHVSEGVWGSLNGPGGVSVGFGDLWRPWGGSLQFLGESSLWSLGPLCPALGVLSVVFGGSLWCLRALQGVSLWCLGVSGGLSVPPRGGSSLWYLRGPPYGTWGVLSVVSGGPRGRSVPPGGPLYGTWGVLGGCLWGGGSLLGGQRRCLGGGYRGSLCAPQ